MCAVNNFDPRSIRDNFLNLCNHQMIVKVGKVAVELAAYKNTPRTTYDHVIDPAFPEFGRVASVQGIKNLPMPLSNLNLVVSRETLRAVNEIETRLLKTKNLWVWLKDNNFNIHKKVQRINSRNVSKRWPAFHKWMQDNIEAKDQELFIKDLKRYVGRKDLWSPGPRIKSTDGKVVACNGLIRIQGSGYENL